jgi:hypothetical protein
MSQIVKLDVGGMRFTTSTATLCRFPTTKIARMFTSGDPESSKLHACMDRAKGAFCIDRDGTHFRHILNFLRSPEDFSVLLTDAEKMELLRECEFYGLQDLLMSSRNPKRKSSASNPREVKFTGIMNTSDYEYAMSL